MGETIIYESNCEVCDAHKTDLGLLKRLEETVKTNFPDWDLSHQSDLVIAWFEKTWKEEMALNIERNKQQNMKMAQNYKKDNINEIRKDK